MAGGDDADAWRFGGRYYAVNVCAGPDVLTVELEDVAPAPGRGTAAVVTYGDHGQTPCVAMYAPELPLVLVPTVP